MCCIMDSFRTTSGSSAFGQSSSTSPFRQSSSSPLLSQSVFSQSSTTNNPLAPKPEPFGSTTTTPFGWPQTGPSIFAGTSNCVFGATQFSAPVFGASSSPALVASSAPAVGSSSSSALGAFGGIGSAFGASTSLVFGPKGAFGASSTPAFAASSSPASSTPAFGASFGPKGAFGASSTPAFAASSSPASSTPAFGASTSSVFGPNGAFGASSTPAFAASSSPAFGVSKTPFGTSSSPSICFGSSPAFEQSASAFISSSHFAVSSPIEARIGSQATTPTFGGAGFGQSGFGDQQQGGGSRVTAYAVTIEQDNGSGEQLDGKLESVSAMPACINKSHEELKWEDYQLSDKGESNPAGQSAGCNLFGASSSIWTPAFGGLSSTEMSNPCFSTIASNLFSSMTSNPFAPKPVSSGFGSGPASSLFRSMPSFATSVLGSQATTPTLGGAGFGQPGFGGQQHRGSRVVAYAVTLEQDDGSGTQPAGKFKSISAMPAYFDKSHEELRWEDYQELKEMHASKLKSESDAELSRIKARIQALELELSNLKMEEATHIASRAPLLPESSFNLEPRKSERTRRISKTKCRCRRR
ncbi:nuclear pore complex protein NUP98A-like isoform X1 [Punica granatum]|uniref:Nuclear pore complex protein NUP98A-like isoform X1 n=1 Tax=Punica granatum TaxID=22663 RepID=A0A6P8C0X7_PUNGR|nr:nuclear pore complex protein NUP98A-like isoform X1 [Punica granatum]